MRKPLETMVTRLPLSRLLLTVLVMSFLCLLPRQVVKAGGVRCLMVLMDDQIASMEDHLVIVTRKPHSGSGFGEGLAAAAVELGLSVEQAKLREDEQQQFEVDQASLDTQFNRPRIIQGISFDNEGWIFKDALSRERGVVGYYIFSDLRFIDIADLAGNDLSFRFFDNPSRQTMRVSSADERGFYHGSEFFAWSRIELETLEVAP